MRTGRASRRRIRYDEDEGEVEARLTCGSCRIQYFARSIDDKVYEPGKVVYHW